jgi:hypothetical protein
LKASLKIQFDPYPTGRICRANSWLMNSWLMIDRTQAFRSGLIDRGDFGKLGLSFGESIFESALL